MASSEGCSMWKGHWCNSGGIERWMKLGDRICSGKGKAKQNRKKKGKAKRKGMRKLNSLGCSINYDKARE